VIVVGIPNDEHCNSAPHPSQLSPFTIDWSGMDYLILVVRMVGDHYEKIGSFVARLVKIFEFGDKRMWTLGGMRRRKW